MYVLIRRNSMLCDFWVHCSCIAFITSKQQKCNLLFLENEFDAMSLQCNFKSHIWALRRILLNDELWKILCKLIKVLLIEILYHLIIFSFCKFSEWSFVMLRLAAEGENSNLAESNGWRDSIIQLLGRMSERSQFIETSFWRIAGKIFHFEIPIGYSNFVLTKQNQYHY